VEYANAIVTANGRPSGIATTIITTDKINAEITDEPTFAPPSLAHILIIKTINVHTDAPRPIKPIYTVYIFNILNLYDKY
jgi:hypothetical protein